MNLKCLPRALLNRNCVVTTAALVVKGNNPAGYEQYKLLFNEIKRRLRNFPNFPVQKISFSAPRAHDEALCSSALKIFLCVLKESFLDSQNPRAVWVGRDLKNHPIPSPAMSREPSM